MCCASLHRAVWDVLLGCSAIYYAMLLMWLIGFAIKRTSVGLLVTMCLLDALSAMDIVVNFNTGGPFVP
jgi:hypothetical protein